MSSPKRATSPDQKNIANRTVGLDGWYVFDGKSIRGPVSDRELANIDADPILRRKTQVSREGFQRWYSLEEISRLISLKQIDSRPDLRDEVEEFQRSYHKKMNQLETLEKSFGLEDRMNHEDSSDGSFRIFHLDEDEDDFQPATVASSRASNDFGKEPKLGLPKDNFETLLAEATMKGVTSNEEFREVASPQIHEDELEADQEYDEDGQNLLVNVDEQVSDIDAAQPALSKIENFQTDYVVLKGRLRLGQNRHVFSVAFMLPILSLGLSIWNWYRNCALECAYHLTSNFSRLVPPYFLAVIPGLSSWMFYRVAQLVEAMERQNNYRTTSPAVAALLGVIPPLGIAYLQPRINRHWNLHIQSAQAAAGSAANS